MSCCQGGLLATFMTFSRYRKYTPGDAFVGYHADTTASVVLQVTSNLTHSEQSECRDEDTFEEKVCQKPDCVVSHTESREKEKHSQPWFVSISWHYGNCDISEILVLFLWNCYTKSLYVEFTQFPSVSLVKFECWNNRKPANGKMKQLIITPVIRGLVFCIVQRTV